MIEIARCRIGSVRFLLCLCFVNHCWNLRLVFLDRSHLNYYINIVETDQL